MIEKKTRLCLENLNCAFATGWRQLNAHTATQILFRQLTYCVVVIVLCVCARSRNAPQQKFLRNMLISFFLVTFFPLSRVCRQKPEGFPILCSYMYLLLLI